MTQTSEAELPLVAANDSSGTADPAPEVFPAVGNLHESEPMPPETETPRDDSPGAVAGAAATNAVASNA